VCVCINTSKIMYTGMVYIDARMQGKILVWRELASLSNIWHG
jgi:hypothetical protein